jgi:hypothetical protein
MHLLPPQVELDLTCLILTLATLAIAWLTCSLPTRHAGRSNVPKAAMRSRTAGPCESASSFDPNPIGLKRLRHRQNYES